MEQQARRSGQFIFSSVRIPAGAVTLSGELCFPTGASGLVLFAHGSGSSRHSPHNQAVAQIIRDAGVGTLLFDLLTEEEGRVDERTRHLRFDLALLSQRLQDATRWGRDETATRALRLGYFGASTGAAAALLAAAELGATIGAVVSRGGRPDLAGAALSRVPAPTLLIVGGRDELVLRLNEEAFDQLAGPKELAIIPGATHLFPEPGALEEVAQLAAHWFQHYLQP
jgi:predicted alpha/beta-hydrolase family hydrolase